MGLDSETPMEGRHMRLNKFTGRHVRPSIASMWRDSRVSDNGGESNSGLAKGFEEVDSSFFGRHGFFMLISQLLWPSCQADM